VWGIERQGQSIASLFLRYASAYPSFFLFALPAKVQKSSFAGSAGPQDWLCFSGLRRAIYFHTPCSDRYLCSFELIGNWLCFSQSHPNAPQRCGGCNFEIGFELALFFRASNRAVFSYSLLTQAFISIHPRGKLALFCIFPFYFPFELSPLSFRPKAGIWL